MATTTTNQELSAILDDRQAIAALDQAGALRSAESLADQIRHGYQLGKKLDLSAYKKTTMKNVVVAGMGGSALGADVILHLYKEQLPLPLTINRDYTLPAWVGPETLVVLSSYSGSTEEVLACAAAAKEKQALIVVLAAGGELIALAKANHYPYLLIEPTYNPSGQPRMAVGYSIIALISIFQAAGLLRFSQQELEEVLVTINRSSQQVAVEVSQEQNQAKLLAYLALERRPILVAAEFLEGALHVAANQFNENAKSFADYKVIPEINHHLLEGLRFPSSNAQDHFFIFFQSQLYHPRNHKRLALTQQVVEEQGIESIRIELQAETKLTQVFELITLTTFANLYLAFLEKIDPAPIPTVDWFKEQLKAAPARGVK